MYKCECEHGVKTWQIEVSPKSVILCQCSLIKPVKPKTQYPEINTRYYKWEMAHMMAAMRLELNQLCFGASSGNCKRFSRQQPRWDSKAIPSASDVLSQAIWLDNAPSNDLHS